MGELTDSDSNGNGGDSSDDTCTAREADCRCMLPAHLDGPHVCDCGGSWEWTRDGEFRVRAWPGEAIKRTKGKR